MLNGARNLSEYSLRASEGVVGGVDDLYFDDESWSARYLEIGAGGEISSRRSTGETEGYRIRGMDGEIEYLEGFVLDEGTWVIRYVVVDASNWLPGKRVLISPSCISGVGRTAAEVHADLGSLEIKEASARDPGAPTDGSTR